MIRVDVVLPAERSYPVLVGPDASAHLPEVLPRRARRAAIVTQSGIGHIVDSGLEQEVFDIGDGEEAKSMATVEGLCRSFARWGLTRGDVVVGVGGGVVTDVAGFGKSGSISYTKGHIQNSG